MTIDRRHLLRPVTADEPVQPRPLLNWAVFALALLICLTVDMVVWTIVFAVTNAWSADAGRFYADHATRIMWGGVSLWFVEKALWRRLGWRR